MPLKKKAFKSTAQTPTTMATKSSSWPNDVDSERIHNPSDNYAGNSNQNCDEEDTSNTSARPTNGRRAIDWHREKWQNAQCGIVDDGVRHTSILCRIRSRFKITVLSRLKTPAKLDFACNDSINNVGSQAE